MERTHIVWYALAASLYREGFSQQQVAEKLTEYGYKASRWSVHMMLRRAREKYGIDVPSRDLKLVQSLRWLDPELQQRHREACTKLWQRPGYGLPQRQALAEQTAKLRASKNPYAQKRKNFLNDLRKNTDLTREERLAEADKYFPPPTISVKGDACQQK